MIFSNRANRVLLVSTLIQSVICCFAILCSANSCHAETLRTKQQFHASVNLTAWREDGTVRFEDADGKAFDVLERDILRYGFGDYSRSGQGIYLIDGSYLVGRILKIDTDRIELSGQYFRVSLPRPIIRSVLVHAPGLDGIEQNWLTQSTEAKGADDRIQTVDEDWTVGTLDANESGVLFDAGSIDQLSVVTGRTARLLPWQRTRGIIFSPLLTSMLSPSSSVTVGLQDGSRLTISSSPVITDATWNFQLACGVKLVSRPDSLTPNSIVYLGKNQASIEASEDLSLLASNILRIRNTPLFGLPENLEGRNFGAGEGRLNSRNHWVDNGFRLKAGSQAVFRVPPGTKRLTAELVGDSAPTSSVQANFQPIQCSISVVSTEGKASQLWNADLISPGLPVKPIDLPLSNAAAIILTVERTSMDQPALEAVWLSPLLHKGK